jgi:putative transposase
LNACYPIVFFDALRVKIRDEGLVKNKAVYVTLALDAEGHKHVLGLMDRADRRRQVLAEGDERP